ncbi:pirin family protein [Kineobactrum salinum]|uniref:Pirin family protein n=1 Tax=Kineobactrum salinum TaxID=2708301 RepID=A0A6C0U1X9_9GAMM|nr:pirin family protein [Kineobactrum salinum]QIB66026.1 pirin family protein [Kineobactrum salinum]
MAERSIQEVRAAQPSRDGDGVAIYRVAGMQHAAMDPVLMIDELRSEQREDFIGGFPPHPHRGMQTLTYMKHGGLIHEDNSGNRGEIRSGGAQWMSAGRGIIHSEMPTVDTRGLHGFQLWVNLPAADKMNEPDYRDIPAQEMVTLAAAAFDATVIAGNWTLDGESASGPLQTLAARAGVLDLQLQPGAAVTVEVAPGDSLLGYIYAGSMLHEQRELGPRQLLITSHGERWQLLAGAGGASLLLLRGEPLGEPVAQYGPFVMNTAAEIEQAIQDYQNGRFVPEARPLQ